ncbi:xylulokinase [[Clostridium] cellulosi]
MKYVLGIDIGTSGTKTVLFDLAGNVMASATGEYPMYQPHNGWAEQDPEDWWKAVCSTIKEVLKKSGADPKEIGGVGLSGQMHGLVMLDKDNKVIRNAILWCDQRTAAQCEEISEIIGRKKLIDITANPALTGFTASKILWVRENEPENYEKCRKILLPKDYIRFMLTGEYATEVSDASGMQLLDIPNRCWSDEVLTKLQIDKSMLGKMYESPEVTGKVHRQAAEATGLAEGTIVVGGAGDNAAAAVGTGVVKDKLAFATIGTSGVVYAHSSKVRIDPKGRVHSFCSAVPGEWLTMGVTLGAGLSLKWFRDNFCHAEIEQAKREGKNVYYLTDMEAAKIKPGCDRLLYLPYIMGERTPHLDPDCRGVFFGLSAMHTRAHLIRAVLEGVSHSLLDCVMILREMGIEINQMMACGGGGSSPLWREMLSDMFGCEVMTVAQKEGPALGVALLAGVGAGAYSSVQEACEAVIKTDKVQKPDAKRTELYLKYHVLYNQLYKSLQNDFKTLANIEEA